MQRSRLLEEPQKSQSAKRIQYHNDLCIVEVGCSDGLRSVAIDSLYIFSTPFFLLIAAAANMAVMITSLSEWTGKVYSC